MILIPRVRFEGGTSLPPSEVAARMRQFLEDPPPSAVPPSLMPMWGNRYSGQVTESTFRLTALSKFKQGYLPVFAGSFLADAGQTRVCGVVAASTGEMAALGIGVLVFAGLLRSVVVLGMGVAAHVFAYLFGFLPHKNAFEAWLEGLPGWEWGRRTRG
jgi:hypothetical protein